MPFSSHLLHTSSLKTHLHIPPQPHLQRHEDIIRAFSKLSSNLLRNKCAFIFPWVCTIYINRPRNTVQDQCSEFPECGEKFFTCYFFMASRIRSPFTWHKDLLHLPDIHHCMSLPSAGRIIISFLIASLTRSLGATGQQQNHRLGTKSNASSSKNT